MTWRLLINCVGIVVITAAIWQWLDAAYIPSAILLVGGVALAFVRNRF
jgi:hypothetical protein